MCPQVIYIWYIFLYNGVRTVYGLPQLAHFHLLESYTFSTSTRIHHLYFKKWLLWGWLNWEMATDIYIYIYILLRLCISFPGGSVIKESTCNAGDPPECRRSDFDLWFGKIPWRRKCNPLQYSCLGHAMDRGAWWAYSPCGRKSRTSLAYELRCD